MTRFAVGLGSNLGSRAAMIGAAADLLGATPGLTAGARSPLYVTEPLGGQGPPYYNAALSLEGDVPPAALLERLLEVERWLGRVRTVRFSPRTIDLDLLWASEAVDDPPRLVVPHPALTERPFALAPLLDVAPHLRGALGGTLERLGGRPPVAPGRGMGQWDPVDQAAAELTARLRERAPLPAPGAALRVRQLPAGQASAGAEGLWDRALEGLGDDWGILRVALGPFAGGPGVFLVGGPRER
jgi:2-amino-4-hydroxy-6-hydroxymethyldihydropteridine diphosphokinase